MALNRSFISCIEAQEYEVMPLGERVGEMATVSWGEGGGGEQDLKNQSRGGLEARPGLKTLQH
jgi:hypothetical protein